VVYSKKCYIKINDYKKFKWKENFRSYFLPETFQQIIEKIKNIIDDYTVGKSYDFDLDNYKRLKLKISFSVEVKDEVLNIKGLEKFQADLENNIYSVDNCSRISYALICIKNFRENDDTM